MDALNTSDHTLILATVGVDVKRAAPKAAKILTKPRWEKCDHNIYISFNPFSCMKFLNRLSLLLSSLCRGFKVFYNRRYFLNFRRYLKN
jgi:hypothetical protein